MPAMTAAPMGAGTLGVERSRTTKDDEGRGERDEQTSDQRFLPKRYEMPLASRTEPPSPRRPSDMETGRPRRPALRPDFETPSQTSFPRDFRR
jgi:hypothetical protein